MNDKKNGYMEGKYEGKNRFSYGNKKELSLEELKKFAGGRNIIDGVALTKKSK